MSSSARANVLSFCDSKATNSDSAMNSYDSDVSGLHAAIQELSRQNDRLTCELGAAQETLDLFEKYRQLTGEYMEMCICSASHYLKVRWQEYEQQYHTLTVSNTSSHSHTSPLSGSLSSISPGNYADGNITIQLVESQSKSKSKIQSFLDSRYESPQLFSLNKSQSSRKRLFSDFDSNTSGVSLLMSNQKNTKLSSNPILNSFLSGHNGHAVSHELESDDDSDNQQDIIIATPHRADKNSESNRFYCSPPPLMNGRVSQASSSESEPQSILCAALGAKYSTNTQQYHEQPFPTLDLSPILQNGLSITPSHVSKNNLDNNKRFHLSCEERTSIIDRLNRQEVGAKIARDYGITKQAVSAIKRRANLSPDVSLIVKNVSPTFGSDNNQRFANNNNNNNFTVKNDVQSKQNKFSRKFPDNSKSYCLLVDPLQILKKQQQFQNKQSQPKTSLLTASSTTTLTSNNNSNVSTNTSAENLLSKLLKGEMDVSRQYVTEMQNLNAHNQSVKETTQGQDGDDEEEDEDDGDDGVDDDAANVADEENGDVDEEEHEESVEAEESEGHFEGLQSTDTVDSHDHRDDSSLSLAHEEEEEDDQQENDNKAIENQQHDSYQNQESEEELHLTVSHKDNDDDSDDLTTEQNGISISVVNSSSVQADKQQNLVAGEKQNSIVGDNNESTSITTTQKP